MVYLSGDGLALSLSPIALSCFEKLMIGCSGGMMVLYFCGLGVSRVDEAIFLDPFGKVDPIIDFGIFM
jgi:hypothetical protein